MKENNENRIQKIRKRIDKIKARLKAVKKRLGFLAPYLILGIKNWMYLVLGIIIVYGFLAQFLGWV